MRRVYHTDADARKAKELRWQRGYYHRELVSNKPNHTLFHKSVLQKQLETIESELAAIPRRPPING